MNKATKHAISDAAIAVGQHDSRFGTPRPHIEVRMPCGTHFRQLHAVLHRLAAEVELATPTCERWIVQTDHVSDERGRVYLELADGSVEEAKRGATLLRRLCS